MPSASRPSPRTTIAARIRTRGSTLSQERSFPPLTFPTPEPSLEIPARLFHERLRVERRGGLPPRFQIRLPIPRAVLPPRPVAPVPLFPAAFALRLGPSVLFLLLLAARSARSRCCSRSVLGLRFSLNASTNSLASFAASAAAAAPGSANALSRAAASRRASLVAASFGASVHSATVRASRSTNSVVANDRAFPRLGAPRASAFAVREAESSTPRDFPPRSRRPRRLRRSHRAKSPRHPPRAYPEARATRLFSVPRRATRRILPSRRAPPSRRQSPRASRRRRASRARVSPDRTPSPPPDDRTYPGGP